MSPQHDIEETFRYTEVLVLGYVYTANITSLAGNKIEPLILLTAKQTKNVSLEHTKVKEKTKMESVEGIVLFVRL